MPSIRPSNVITFPMGSLSLTILLFSSVLVWHSFCQPPGSILDQNSVTNSSKDLLVETNETTRSLEIQNQVRKTLGLELFTWDQALTESAEEFANSLAASGVFGHSGGNLTAGENVWRGPAGSLSIPEIIQVWINEKQFYIDGIFPSISTTYDWTDVANYSQIIWSSTRRVGCALVNSVENDYYVCHYAPRGNIWTELTQDIHGLINYVVGTADRMRWYPGQYTAELQWQPALGISSQRHANYLAKNNIFEHSGNPDVGENLWSGPKGVFTVDEMAQVWLNERQYFVSNRFPNISITGDPNDAANYSQIVWKDTWSVGCGLATGSTNDYLVCHFSPRGNIIGQTPLSGSVDKEQPPGNGGQAEFLILDIPANPSGNNQTDSLDAHNQVRMATMVDYIVNLTWDSSLARSAQNFANYLSENDVYEHSGNLDIGENMWHGSTGIFTIYQIIQVWFDEIQYYDEGSFLSQPIINNLLHSANYSQIIWYSATKVGCGFSTNGKTDYYVCHYDSPWSRAAQCRPSAQNIESDAVNGHNKIRMAYGVGNLTWDEDLMRSAQKFANHLAEKDVIERSGNISIGESRWSGAIGIFSVCLTLQFWLDQEMDDAPDDVLSRFDWVNIAEYRQLIWSNATKVGCGLATNTINDYFVCHYDSPWNVAAQYRFDSEQTALDSDQIPNKFQFGPEEIASYPELQSRVGIDGSLQNYLIGVLDLQTSAQARADYLAQNNLFEHNQDVSVGETLWSGPVGTFSLPQIIQVWLDEKKFFVNGVFPNVSTTGNWADVSNYTQIIWTGSRNYGCGFASSTTHDYYICHFSPPGNVNGLRPISFLVHSEPDVPMYDLQGLFNSTRKEYFLDMLVWDRDLAESAYNFGSKLASNVELNKKSNSKVGQTIWCGPAGFFNTSQIAKEWIKEKQFYINGIFPNVSSTGDWTQVGNYTQIIWSDTTRFGCAMIRAPPLDYFICHYSPRGNIVGQNPIDGANTLPQATTLSFLNFDL